MSSRTCTLRTTGRSSHWPDGTHALSPRYGDYRAGRGRRSVRQGMPGSNPRRGDRRRKPHDQRGGASGRGVHSLRPLPRHLRAGPRLQPDPAKRGLRPAEREDRAVQLRRDLGHSGAVPSGGGRPRRPAGDPQAHHPFPGRCRLLREGDLRRGRASRTRDPAAAVHGRQLLPPSTRTISSIRSARPSASAKGATRPSWPRASWSATR